MAERDLLFHDTVAPHLAAYAPEASAAQQRGYLIFRGQGKRRDIFGFLGVFWGPGASSQHFCWRISGAGVAEVHLGGVKAV
jgi:hypothetical protein